MPSSGTKPGGRGVAHDVIMKIWGRGMIMSHDIMGRGVIMWRQHGMGMITSHDNGYDHVIKYGRGVVMSHVGDSAESA